MLEKAGADFVIMPCHTAHIWINEIKEAIKIPFYSIIENTVQMTLEQEGNSSKKIILLATETLINSQLYQNAFENSSFEIIIPTTKEQNAVDQAIQKVKSGKVATRQDIKDLNQLLTNYANTGISTLLGCCTEIPLMLPFLDTDMKTIDPTLMLAKLAIKKALAFGG